jgi:amicoumacin kinase
LEKWIRARFHPGVLQEAMRRYDVQENQIRELDSFENFIYEFEYDGREYILRIGHSHRRSENLVRGEVDWINYLSDGGVSVARAVPSKEGNLVEPVADGQDGHFLAAAFIKAYGEQPWFVRTQAFYHSYGRLLGSMHALTAHYQPKNIAWKRPEWNDPSMDIVARGLPDGEEGVKQKYRELVEHLRSLPKDPTCYGLIHQDVHAANFLMDEAGNLTLFDFDDCAYNWYAYDIAIALFYMVLEAPEGPAFAQEFLPHLIEGYRSVYPIDDFWLREIPYFLKVREIELYAVIYSSFGPEPVQDEWCLNYMRGRRERIEQGVPYIENENWMSKKNK